MNHQYWNIIRLFHETISWYKVYSTMFAIIWCTAKLKYSGPITKRLKDKMSCNNERVGDGRRNWSLKNGCHFPFLLTARDNFLPLLRKRNIKLSQNNSSQKYHQHSICHNNTLHQISMHIIIKIYNT